MGQPVVHFEVIGRDPATLQDYYQQLFGWEFSVGNAVSERVSASGEYDFIDAEANGGGINGGVGGGVRFQQHVIFYVKVASVESALEDAERLGGKRLMGPEGTPGRLVVGQFTDPEGNLIGVASGIEA